MTATMTEIGIIQDTQIKTSNENGKSAHIVWVPPGAETTAVALVLAARIEGFEIEALCGYRWIPSQNPRKLPVCQKCMEIYQQPGDNREDRNDLPPD